MCEVRGRSNQVHVESLVVAGGGEEEGKGGEGVEMLKQKSDCG